MEEKKFDEAIEELKKLQGKHPKKIEVVNLLGWSYLHAGKFELAFNAWRHGMTLDSKSQIIKDSIARARLVVGKKLKESEHYTQALVQLRDSHKPKA